MLPTAFPILSTLTPRDSTTSDQCDGAQKHDQGDNLSIGITTQRLLEYISAAGLGVSAILVVGLILRHLACYTIPREQRQIVRIIFFPVVFAAFAFLSVAFYDAAVYLRPVASIYEAICLPALLILYFNYVCPVEQSLWNFFGQIQLTDRHGKPLQGGTLRWVKKVWIFVFQCPFIFTVAAIVEIATEAAHHYCAGSLKPKYGHLWVEILTIVALVLAIPNVIRFESRMKKEGYIEKRHKPAAKLWTFKGLVGLQFLQQIIFGLLNGRVFNATATITYNDLYYGIPNTITCLEAPLFALAFWWSFNPSEYHPDVVHTQGYKMAFWRACIDSLNISDLVSGVGTMCKLIAEGALSPTEKSQEYSQFAMDSPSQALHPQQRVNAYQNAYQSH